MLESPMDPECLQESRVALVPEGQASLVCMVVKILRHEEAPQLA